MPEPGTRDWFFTDLAEWCIRRVSGCPRTRRIDHPHRAVAVNPRHDADMRPVLAGVKVGTEEEDQIARFGAAGTEASADRGVVLQLARTWQTKANRTENRLDEATAVDPARRAAAEQVARAEPPAGLGEERRRIRQAAVRCGRWQCRKQGGQSGSVSSGLSVSGVRGSCLQTAGHAHD